MSTTIVIGAGQAGLAMSRCLTARGQHHVVLERGRIGQRWRRERWDSFTLLSPNWQTRLPGRRYAGADPDGFMTGREVGDMLEDYAVETGAPVCEGVTVTAVSPTRRGWRVRTDNGDLVAGSVVVATGDLDRPAVPALADDLPGHLTQVHTSGYRNPDALPPGGVLVVGAGPSGQQIALELARAGRTVHLAVGRHKNLPRRYRGHDTYWWMDRMGTLSRTVDSLSEPTATRTPNAVLTGGTRDLDLHRLVDAGVRPYGRLVGVRGNAVGFDDGLPAMVADAEANAVRFRARVDSWVEATGLAAPAEPAPPARSPSWAADAPAALDLEAEGVSTVVWATGFRRDFSWIHAPVVDDAGEPVHRRGITTAPAAATRFGGIVVQGGVTTAVLNAVVAEDLPGPGSVFLSLDLRFSAPVRPGDVITGRVEVTAARADKPITELAVSVTRDDGVVAVTGTAVCYTATPATVSA
ncbi:NAD(P)-binding domain-containing protein [Actinomycetospora endophytica]|uniref:NAD(P)-binding domain-containing protein n=1 Tax=Actinomycetospora endophytica TaxID=2291215 RepID=A0ABS8PD18_9PSEU|nr:NAD(P)-binding domain-containing protein [Actinomycetospora endophytica]MCD2195802.1 NAD(P)-binding domain-containing protein [Actinomycetospora endophytica]